MSSVTNNDNSYPMCPISDPHNNPFSRFLNLFFTGEKADVLIS